MTVNEIGRYRVLNPLSVGNLVTQSVLPVGSIINVVQIDPEYRKVYAKELLDWKHWDLPVEKV
jgi:hypothetical protein